MQATAHATRGRSPGHPVFPAAPPCRERANMAGPPRTGGLQLHATGGGRSISPLQSDRALRERALAALQRHFGEAGGARAAGRLLAAAGAARPPAAPPAARPPAPQALPRSEGCRSALCLQPWPAATALCSCPRAGASPCVTRYPHSWGRVGARWQSSSRRLSVGLRRVHARTRLPWASLLHHPIACALPPPPPPPPPDAALMQDQVSGLLAKGVRADYLASTRSERERRALLADLVRALPNTQVPPRGGQARVWPPPPPTHRPPHRALLLA